VQLYFNPSTVKMLSNLKVPLLFFVLDRCAALAIVSGHISDNACGLHFSRFWL
jgi:hypothetical protein